MVLARDSSWHHSWVSSNQTSPSWDQSGSWSVEDTSIFTFALCFPSLKLDEERGADSLKLPQPTMTQKGGRHWFEDWHCVLYWTVTLIGPRYHLDMCSALWPSVPFLMPTLQVHPPGPAASALAPTHRITLATPMFILLALKFIPGDASHTTAQCNSNMDLPETSISTGTCFPHCPAWCRLERGKRLSTREVAPNVPFKRTPSVSSDGGKVKQMTNERHGA